MNSAENFIPHRTCISCRQQRSKNELLRFTLQDDAVVLDKQQQMGGRGAYVCASETCLLRAIKTGAFARAFRRQVKVDAHHITEEFTNG